jgi:histidinol phosphatase-like enzyme
MPRFHPIHYSLALNALILGVAGALAYAFASPTTFICAILLCQHLPARFPSPEELAAGVPEREPAIGFLANVGSELDDDME